ncbi:MAG: hypothetical protein Q4D96_10035 [Propionibacteriaceae bacterium]|nr:hypothetical protein [Propionibacteriaceae bacterium]
MINSITKLHTRLLSALDDSERGSVSLEQVLITVGLVLVATLVVAGITAAVKSHLAGVA